MDVACWCGFRTAQPDELILHITETGHGMSPEIHAGLLDGGPFAAELRSALRTIMDPELREAAMAEGRIRPVDLDAEDDEADEDEADSSDS